MHCVGARSEQASPRQDLRSNAIEICVRASPDMERSGCLAPSGFLLDDNDDNDHDDHDDHSDGRVLASPGVQLPRLSLTPTFSKPTNTLFSATLAASRKMEDRLNPS